jgi:hypothetical protein
MRHKHKENPNYDYMIKFKKTITEILSELEAHEKTKPKYRLKTWPELLETPEIKSIGFIEGVIQIISKNGSIQTHRTQLGKEVGKEFVGNGLDFVGLIPELFVKIR